MSTIVFLAEWGVRSVILILGGALLLWAMRVKDPSIRLMAWTAMLFGSLAIPALTNLAPRVRFVTAQPSVVGMAKDLENVGAIPVPRGPEVPPQRRSPDRTLIVLGIYGLVGFVLLFRIALGFVMGLRLLRNSGATELFGVRESDDVPAPVTLGVVHPAIVLPSDWRQWSGAKREAVLAHERSHIRRYDPALQFISALHRALLWHNPLSWFLHKQIVRVAEEASDDAALAATHDRAFYAEVLLDFMQGGAGGTFGAGVPMARYGRPDQRIHRILDGTSLSRGVTRGSAAAVLALGCPLTFVVAAAHPADRPQGIPIVHILPVPQAAVPASKPPAPKAPAAPPKAKSALAVLTGLGNVTPLYTVTVRSRVEGQLLSMDFKEGDTVKEGQLLAALDPRPYEIQLAQAQAQLAEDDPAGPRFQSDQANVDRAKLQVAYTRIVAPITGVVGLRMMDAGNVVTTGSPLVVITQFQPDVLVLFTIPEDNVRAVRDRLSDGSQLTVEAWDRTNSTRLATGQLIAVDNQIDETTGTVKLKARFDNKAGALFPNQFVNVRLYLDGR